jgi:hypothetical protein
MGGGTRTRWGAVLAAALVALALTGCGDGAADGGDGAVTASPTAASGGDPAGTMLAEAGWSVAEVRAAATGEPIVVRAYVFIAPDGSARLCDASAESFPPQCSGAAIAVTGLADEMVAAFPEDAGRRWSDEPVQLVGAVRDGTFVNDPAALAAG